MCGIAGTAGSLVPGLVARMCDAIVHRGPDDHGIAEMPEAGLAIGMRRLSIIDIEGGHQPFEAEGGRVRLVFNGEIYNHDELRDALRGAGVVFRTRSDTEVVLQAYLAWGEQCWSRLNGMFAAAVADLRGSAPRLVLARDRFGIKPLYYALSQGRLAFASEIKALLPWPHLDRDIDRQALWEYLSLRYVPAPRTLFRAVRKLPPGHVLSFAGGATDIRRWWDLPPDSVVDPAMDRDEAVRSFGDALEQSVRRHMIADVPVGAYLSAGVDSTVIAALAARHAPGRLRTFSMGFRDFADDELKEAEETARHLGTDHTAVVCGTEDVAAFPDIAWSLDEPFGDAIVLAMSVLARAARREVKVVLSGDGADELLGGYLFTGKLLAVDKARRRLPGPFWPMAVKGLDLVPLAVLERLFDYPGRLGRAGKDKLVRFLAGVGDGGPEAELHRLVTLFDDAEIAAVTRPGAFGTEGRRPPPHAARAGRDGSPFQRLTARLYDDWFADEILLKVDRMTMAHSLEARVPYADDRVVEAAWRIPDHEKLGGGMNKKVLREFAAGLLPAHLLNRPKKAFYLPLESYFQAPAFRDLAGHALDPARLARRGLFDPAAVAALGAAPADQGFLPLKQLFSIIMLELWFDKFCPEATF